MSKLKAQLAQYEEIKKIMDRAEEVEEGEPREAEYRSRPFPPATEAEIKAFEKKLGYKLPPSYREFLGIHNGWQCFWGATWIAGVSGRSLSYVRGRLRERKKLLVSYAEWDPTKDLVLGADDNGEFLVFDSKADKNGERKVLDCPGGFAENTFDSFANLLEVQLRCRIKEIARLPKALRTLPASSQAKARRFECKDAGSRKFWTVASAAKDVTYTWGRIGTGGQSKTKAFKTPDAAKKEVAALIAEKTKKGYKEVRGS